MSKLLESYVPVVMEAGLNTNKAVAFGSTLAVTGAATFAGAVTFAVAPTVTAGSPLNFVTTTADTIAVTAAQTSSVFLATKASATQVFTLPAAAAGLNYTFICGHASGEILINPTGSIATTFTTFAAVGADADTAIVTLSAGTGLKNTAATNAIGDSIRLVSDGTNWFGIGITSGIWATQ